jgi:hypothetical protein
MKTSTIDKQKIFYIQKKFNETFTPLPPTFTHSSLPFFPFSLPDSAQSQCTKNSWNIETCNKTFCLSLHIHSLPLFLLSTHLRLIESHSQCTKNSWNIETMCNKTFVSTLTFTHLSLFFSSHFTLSSQPSKPARMMFNAFECSPLYSILHLPAFPHPHHVVPSAILQALNGNPCNLIAAGLIYPQNVTTPINTQTIFIT